MRPMRPHSGEAQLLSLLLLPQGSTRLVEALKCITPESVAQTYCSVTGFLWMYYAVVLDELLAVLRFPPSGGREASED